MRVVIAEDQVLLRVGLERLFTDGGHEVVAAVGDADTLQKVLQTDEPALVVVDVRMPPTFTDEGARAALRIKRERPHVGVLVLSQHVETAHMTDLAVMAGFGYLLKDRVLEVEDFLQTAERVARGGSALDPHVVATLFAGRGEEDPLAALTERERTVLGLMAQGLTNTGIAKRLFVSERTVEAHVRHLMGKLDMPETEDDHRRVLAVLAQLSVSAPGRPGTG